MIANACESAPLQVVTGVRRQDAFWLKGQPYSLDNLLDFDPRAAAFEGGTLYQAFLSALNYHRWHSPVSGTVRSVMCGQRQLLPGQPPPGFRQPGGARPQRPRPVPALPHRGGDLGTHLHRGGQPPKSA